jgi:hypothetical protein
LLRFYLRLIERFTRRKESSEPKLLIEKHWRVEPMALEALFRYRLALPRDAASKTRLNSRYIAWCARRDVEITVRGDARLSMNHAKPISVYN